jgi:hypothetical protein
LVAKLCRRRLHGSDLSQRAAHLLCIGSANSGKVLGLRVGNLLQQNGHSPLRSVVGGSLLQSAVVQKVELRGGGAVSQVKIKLDDWT